MAAAAAAILCLGVAQASAQVSNYVVGPQDVLTIAVYDQQDLGGKYAVEADGSFSFPLIGRVAAGGLTLREIEEQLRTKLKDGFFKNPQVSVAVEQYRSQRVFVVGEVRSPGTYPLTGDMTLIEALARAGSTKEEASGEALIVRPRTEKPVDGPVLPGQEQDAEVIRVNVKEVQSGKLSSNVRLRDNDTIFVPRAELVYVFGQVKTPGAYPLREGTTVLQALSLAGGLTDRGAVGRINIVRVTDGKRSEVRAKLDDAVRAGDTILVPERFF